MLHQMTLYIENIYIYIYIYHYYQSGYRKNYLTLTILIKLRDDIERALKSGEFTLALFVDFSKAFDTIDFNILIHKLHSLHFSKNLVSHFKFFIKQKPFCKNRFTPFQSFIFRIWWTTRVDFKTSIVYCMRQWYEELCSQMYLLPVCRRFNNIIDIAKREI